MKRSTAAGDRPASENGLPETLRAALQLPAALKAPALAVLGRDPRGAPVEDWALLLRRRYEAADALDGMTPADRGRVFAALFPALAAEVEAAWLLKRAGPYQEAFERKVFRAPNSPAVTRRARIDWLAGLARELEGVRQDVTALAERAFERDPLGEAESLGPVYAAAIDGGGPAGETVYGLFSRSARGEAPAGSPGRQAVRALLLSARPDAWEIAGGLLVEATRPEERQLVLTALDDAHPGAFRRLLRLIREHDLGRLAPAVRALDDWLGYQWDAVSVRTVNRVLDWVLRFLEDRRQREAALAGDDAEVAYLALWSHAFEDAVAAVGAAARLLRDADVERRFVAAHLLGQLDLPEARQALAQALDDADLRVALRALEDCWPHDAGEGSGRGDVEDLFERTERLLARMPAEKTHLEPIVWPWHVLTADAETVASDLSFCLGDRPPTRLAPYLARMEPWTRAQSVARIGRYRKWDRRTRSALFALLGDESEEVRSASAQALTRCRVTAEEARCLEQLLKRAKAEMRVALLGLLANQPEKGVWATVDRLLDSPRSAQRTAGLELLQMLAQSGAAVRECRDRARRYRTRRGRLSAREALLVEGILGAGRRPRRLAGRQA